MITFTLQRDTEIAIVFNLSGVFAFVPFLVLWSFFPGYSSWSFFFGFLLSFFSLGVFFWISFPSLVFPTAVFSHFRYLSPLGSFLLIWFSLFLLRFSIKILKKNYRGYQRDLLDAENRILISICIFEISRRHRSGRWSDEPVSWWPFPRARSRGDISKSKWDIGVRFSPSRSAGQKP